MHGAPRGDSISMATVATTTPSISRSGLTFDDYLAFPDDGVRHEIIAGRHYVSAAPYLDHQRISRRIQFQLYEQIELPGRGEVFNAPTAVQLSDHDVVEPDLLVVLAERDSYLSARKVEGPPDLVVEILSPSSERRDRELKLRLYERAGVGEYWIVDPLARQVVKYVRRETLLEPAGSFGEQVAFDGLPGVVVDLGPVWGP